MVPTFLATFLSRCLPSCAATCALQERPTMLTTTPGKALCAAFMFHGFGGRAPPLVRAFCNTAVTSAAVRTAKGVPASYGKKAPIRPLLAAGENSRVCRRHVTVAYMSTEATTPEQQRLMEEEVDPGEIEGTDLRVLKYPHPSLRAKNEQIREFNTDLKNLAAEMFKVMYAMNGVGLAAPQVGVNKRIMVFNPGDETNRKDEVVLVNPQIVALGMGKSKEEEGCLSFPGMRGKVVRSKWVKVEAFNEKGKKIRIKYHDWTARIFMHEYDHLDGVVYIDRLDEGERAKVQPTLDKLVEAYGEGGAL